MELSRLACLIGFYVAAGTFVSVAVIKSSEIGRKYYYYYAAVWVFLTVAFLLQTTRFPSLESLRPLICAFLLFALTYVATLGRTPRGSWIAYLGASACAFLVVLKAIPTHLFRNPAFLEQPFIFQTNALLSMLLVGFAVGAMSLRQWSHQRPKLPRRNLKRLTLVLLCLVAVRIGFSWYVLTKSFVGKSEIEIYRGFFSASPGIFLLLRGIWGLLGPLLLSYLVWHSGRLRTAHTSVAILYATALCVLTGEALSQYLAWVHGLPI